MKTHCKNGHEFTGDNLAITPHGYRRCRACQRDKAKKYYWQAGQREKALAWHRKHYEKRRDHVLATKKLYRSEKRHLEAKYNLQTSYAEMVASQRGLCGACGLPPDERGLNVDHDHSCCSGPKSCGNCVRELLCWSCNVALGQVNDSEERLLSLIDYLARHKNKAENVA